MPLMLIDDDRLTARLQAYIESSGKAPADALADLLPDDDIANEAKILNEPEDIFDFTEEDSRGTSRLEAYSDGVFATAGTLLVFSLVLPEVNEPGTEGLIAALIAQAPVYVGLFISFILIGTTWVQHHRMFRYIQKNDHLLMILNLLLMLTIVLIPFVTSFVTTFIREPAQESIGALLYGGTWFIGTVLWNMMWLHAKHAKLIDPAMSPAAIRYVTNEFYTGPIFYAVALVASFINLSVGLTLFALPGLYYLLPHHSIYRFRAKLGLTPH